MSDTPVVPPLPDASALPPTSNAPPPVAATPQAPPTPQQSVPTPSPILYQLIRGLTHPPVETQTTPDGTAQFQRPVSRLSTFENFLGNFVSALGQGLSAAHGPGAFGKGFGAAATAPYQQDLQRFQLGQEAQANQARVGQEQAQTALTQQQARLAGQMATVNIPGLGAVTAPMSQLGNILKGSGAAAIGAQAKMGAAQLQVAVASGTVSHLIPDVDPKTGQKFYHAINKFGQDMGNVDANVIPSLQQKTSQTVDWKTDADGNYIALPKTRVSGPVLPGQPQPSAQVASGARAQLQAKIPSMATGSLSDGRQIAGTPSELKAAGATGITKLEGSDASKVSIARQLTAPGGLFPLVEQDIAQFNPDELTALGGRWNEFLTGKLGTGDPRYAALRTHLTLLSTALMQAHVGSRGGEHMMDHFADLANAGKMNGDILASAIGAERQYVQEKAMRPPIPSGKRNNKVLDPLGIR